MMIFLDARAGSLSLLLPFVGARRGANKARRVSISRESCALLFLSRFSRTFGMNFKQAHLGF